MNWPLDPSLRPLFESDRVFVGEWRCPGERRPWSTEVTHSFELELPLAGTHLRSIRGRRRVVDPSLAVLHGPDEEYLMASPSGMPKRSTILRMKAGVMAELGQPLQLGIIATSAPTVLLHHRLHRALNPLEREETALMLVERVLRDARETQGPACFRGPQSGAWRRLAEDIQQWIGIHYAEHLTLEGLARNCGASPFHASRVFRAIQGKTIHGYLNQVRLRAALYELEDMQGRLTELSLRVGFSSHSHFSSAFRREFGHSPVVSGKR